MTIDHLTLDLDMVKFGRGQNGILRCISILYNSKDDYPNNEQRTFHKRLPSAPKKI